MIYQINKIIIDTLNFNITIDGVVKEVERQVFDIIVFLVENRHRLVTRQEFFDTVWSGKIVSDGSLSSQIKKARQVLGDDGHKQAFIKTLHCRGFQFVADTIEIKPQAKPNLALTTETELAPDSLINSYLTTKPKPLLLPDKPSVAVMDFEEIGHSEKGTMLANGLTSDINSSLSRLSNLFITARASTKVLSKLALSSKEIAQRLGVHYLVYGNTQCFKSRFKVTISVVDGINDTEIWSEHFDKALDDMFEVQGEITSAIVVAMDFAIEQAEIARSFLISTENLSAWENYHRGLWYLNKTNLEDVQRAQNFFNKAVVLDPQFSRAYAGLSFTHMSAQLLSSIKTDSDYDIQKAYEFSWRSIDACPVESMGYMTLGRVSFFTHEAEKALQAFDKGISLNPNYTSCHFALGMASAYAGSTEQADKHLDKGERLSPFDPLLFSKKMSSATSLVRQKKYTKAASVSLIATYYPNAFFTTYAIAAACQQLAGNNTKAQEFAKKALTLNPHFSIEDYLRFLPFSENATKQLMVNALHDSGIPFQNDSVH